MVLLRHAHREAWRRVSEALDVAAMEDEFEKGQEHKKERCCRTRGKGRRDRRDRDRRQGREGEETEEAKG